MKQHSKNTPSEKKKVRFLIALGGPLALAVGSLLLIFDDSNIGWTLKRIVGLISLVFWMGIMIWGIYKIRSSEKMN